MQHMNAFRIVSFGLWFCPHFVWFFLSVSDAQMRHQFKGTKTNWIRSHRTKRHHTEKISKLRIKPKIYSSYFIEFKRRTKKVSKFRKFFPPFIHGKSVLVPFIKTVTTILYERWACAFPTSTAKKREPNERQSEKTDAVNDMP